MKEQAEQEMEMEQRELSERDVRRAVLAFRVTLVSQLEPLREIPAILEHPSVPPAVTQEAIQELPQYIERTRSTLDELREVEQYADERGIKIRSWEHLNDAEVVLETATIAVWGKLDE